MEKGHMGFRELLLIGVVIIGFAAAIMILMGSGPDVQKPVMANESAVEQGNDDSTLQEEPPANNTANGQPAIKESETTNKTMGQILDEGMARADSRFYEENLSGKFDIKTYRWAMGRMNESPDGIPLRKNDLLASEIRFNGRYIDSLRGFAFKVFEAEGLTAPPKYFGTMLFLSDSAPMDGYAQNTSSFDMQYDPHPELSQILESCTIIGNESLIAPSGAYIYVYDFRCKIMYGASS